MTGQVIPFSIERQDDRPKGHIGHCVYVIASNRNDLVKIGYTSDFGGRLKALQSGSAFKIRIIRLVAGGKKVERDFHVEFARCRAHGEWFRFVPEMMTYKSSAPVDQVDKPQPNDGQSLVPIIQGFGHLEEIDKMRTIGAYADVPLEHQQYLLTAAVIGHIQKAIGCVSEIRGIGLNEAAEVVAKLARTVNEHSPAIDDRVFPKLNTQVGFLFGELPRVGT